MLKLIETPEIRKYATRFGPGACLFNDGDPGDSVFILISGELDVLKGGRIISAISGKGTIFGEISFLLESPRTATVIARNEVEVICLPNEQVAEIWARFPDFAVSLTRILARRLADTTDLAHGFREFCDRMPDAVVMTGPDLKINSWNRAAEKLYGQGWHEMRGHLLSACHDDEAQLHYFLDQVKNEGTVRERLLKVNHPENSWCFASISGTALRDSNGEIRNYIFLARDASEQTKKEIKRRRLSLILPVLLLIVMIGAAAIFFSSPATQKDKGSPPLTNLFQNRLISDSLGLDLALAASGKGRRTYGRIIDRYIKTASPAALAIKAVMIRKKDGKIIVCRESDNGKDCRLREETFPEGTKLVRNRFNIYISERDGRQQLEILRPVGEQEWLSFRLDPAGLAGKFGLAAEDLDKLPLSLTDWLKKGHKTATGK